MSASSLVVRTVWVAASSLLSVIGLVLFFAWLALHVRWDVPHPTALTAPTIITARDGTVLTRLTSEVDRRPVSIGKVSQVAQDAVVAGEDARFWAHQGVDPLALLRAVVSNVRTGSITQGGSTLTQQYVKNAFVGRERTLRRKLREAVISIQLEREVPKRLILERYLNAVYFGEGAWGIEAAALTYFGVHASQLNAAQGALLAQLLPAPSRFNPRDDPIAAEERRDGVLKKMRRLGMLSSQEMWEATTSPIAVKPRRRPPTLHPYFVEYVRRQLLTAYGEEHVLTGGLTVRTTLDLQAQKALAAAVTKHLPAELAPIDAGAVAINPKNGDVIAVYGGRNFRADSYSLATQAARQPGSTFKTFGFVSALETGMSPKRRLPAPGRIRIGTWRVTNAGGSGYGSATISEGLIRSINTVYAQLGNKVGAKNIAHAASRMGVRSRLSTSDITISLGAYVVTVLDMASAYGTLANDGVSCPARSIAEIRGPNGRRLPLPLERRPDPAAVTTRLPGLGERDHGRCYEATDPNVARTTTKVLEQVVSRGTGRRADIRRPQAGKTGTSNENRDAWFAGYTPNLSLTVWVGHRDRPRSLTNVGGFDVVYGGTIPALIWRDAAQAIVAKLPPEKFLKPGQLTIGRDRRRAGPAMSRGLPEDEATQDFDTPAPGPTASGDPATQEQGPDVQPTSPASDPFGATPADTPSEADPGEDVQGDGQGPCVPPVIYEGC